MSSLGSWPSRAMIFEQFLIEVTTWTLKFRLESTNNNILSRYSVWCFIPNVYNSLFCCWTYQIQQQYLFLQARDGLVLFVTSKSIDKTQSIVSALQESVERTSVIFIPRVRSNFSPHRLFGFRKTRKTRGRETRWRRRAPRAHFLQVDVKRTYAATP